MASKRCTREGCGHYKQRHRNGSGACKVAPKGHCSKFTTAVVTPPPPPPPPPDPDLPVADVVITPNQNIQEVINNNPPGTVYRLDGDWTRAAGRAIQYQIRPKENDILFADEPGSGFIQGAQSGAPSTGMAVSAAGVKIINLKVHNFPETCVSLTGLNVRSLNCEFAYGLQNSVSSFRGRGIIIKGGSIHHGGSPAFVGNNAGGIKVAASSDRGSGAGIILDGVHSHNNMGNGIWYDVDSGNCLNDGYPAGEKDCGTNPGIGDNFDGDFFTWTPQMDMVINCLVEDNYRRGIFYEVSRGPVIIQDNRAYRNNAADEGHAAGIGVSSSKNVLVQNNDSRDNNNWDISVGQITRSGTRPWYPGYYTVRKVIIRNNRVGSLSKIRDTSIPGATFTGNYV